jgi:hypothetical protein
MQKTREAVRGLAKDAGGPSGEQERRETAKDPGPSTSRAVERRLVVQRPVAHSPDGDGDDPETEEEDKGQEAPVKKVGTKRKAAEGGHGGEKRRKRSPKKGGSKHGKGKAGKGKAGKAKAGKGKGGKGKGGKGKSGKGPKKVAEDSETSATTPSGTSSEEDDDNSKSYEPRYFHALTGKRIR